MQCMLQHFFRCGEHVISAAQDGAIHRWKSVDGTPLTVYIAHTSTVFALSAMSGKLLTAGRGGRVFCWEPRESCEFCRSTCLGGCKYCFRQCPNEGCGELISEAKLNKHACEECICSTPGCSTTLSKNDLSPISAKSASMLTSCPNF